MLIINWAAIVDKTEVLTDEKILLSDKILAEHIDTYNNPKARRASLSAWSLLYRTLEECGLTVGKVAFEEGGKPFFEGNPVYFSISHSRGVCVVAVADRPVGVDVERVRDSYNPHLVERSLNDREKEFYKVSCDGDFTRIWCRKEAVAKMTGRGIVGYPVGIDTTEYDFAERKIEHDGDSYWLVVCCGTVHG